MNSRLLHRTCPIAPAAAIFALCLFPGCIAGEQELSTTEDPLIGVPGYTGYAVTRDFNGDGWTDLGAINVVGSTFAVRLNKGDGTFHNVVRYSVDPQPTFIATADLNHDGSLDVTVISATSSTFSTLLGGSNGLFRTPHSRSIADPLNGQLAVAPFGVVTEDFNNDGHDDVATSNVVTNNISSLLSNGGETFQPPTTYPLTGPSSLGFVPFPLIAVDFDRDGFLDLVSGGAAHIVMLKGGGDGSFTVVSTYPTGVAMSCIETADLNGDLIPDIATTAIGSSNVSVLLGNGDGTFTHRQTRWSGGIAGECFSFGDLNADGKLDLAIANSSSLFGVGNVAILLGNGDGSFGNPDTYPLGLTPWSASIADINRDGKEDVAVCVGGSSSVSILLGDGDGTLQPPTTYSM